MLCVCSAYSLRVFCVFSAYVLRILYVFSAYVLRMFYVCSMYFLRMFSVFYTAPIMDTIRNLSDAPQTAHLHTEFLITPAPLY